MIKNSVNLQNGPQASGGYAQAVEVQGAARKLVISGQIGKATERGCAVQGCQQLSAYWIYSNVK